MPGDKTGFLLFIPTMGICAGTGFLMHFSVKSGIKEMEQQQLNEQL